jgi:hypothetical protein
MAEVSFLSLLEIQRYPCVYGSLIWYPRLLHSMLMYRHSRIIVIIGLITIFRYAFNRLLCLQTPRRFLILLPRTE